MLSESGGMLGFIAGEEVKGASWDARRPVTLRRPVRWLAFAFKPASALRPTLCHAPALHMFTSVTAWQTGHRHREEIDMAASRLKLIFKLPVRVAVSGFSSPLLSRCL